MKKLLFAAAAAAFIFTGCGAKNATNTPANTDSTTVAVGTDTVAGGLAFVRVQDVLMQSDLFKQEGAPLQDKTQKAQNRWTQNQQSLQAEANKLQDDYQKGLVTTLDAQNKQQSLQQRADSYQRTQQQEAQSLDEENQVFTNRAQDLMQRAIKAINADRRYKMIVDATALLDADSLLDITPAVLAKVNELYAADKKK